MIIIVLLLCIPTDINKRQKLIKLKDINSVMLSFYQFMNIYI